MRSFAAALCAALAGALALSDPGGETGKARAPKGRAPARRDGGSADGGSADGGSANGGTARQRSRPAPHVLGDPPGSMRFDTAPARPDAGPPEVSTRVEKLEQEMADLRARSAALEGQLQQARDQARMLQQLSQQIADLRSQIASETERRAQAEEQQAARREQVESAVSRLVYAEQALATGDSAVGAALDDAERTFSGQAGRDVAAARLALQNHDLAQARYLLGSAIAHARQGQ